jgi:exodeoxyribonuclease-3
LALQETKLLDENFPVREIGELGYNAVFCGQKTYNGVAILSKGAPEEIIAHLPDQDDGQRRFICATVQGVRIVNVYAPNGESLDSPKYLYKLQWLERLTGYLQQQLLIYPNLVVLGDFNVAPGPEDVYDPMLLEGQLFYSEPEHQAFNQLIVTGVSDCFRRFSQPDNSYTWWDYRQVAFRRNRGLRIDHILASNILASRCQRCVIDIEPRKGERPSDHAPVVAEFDLISP